jgi:hypothetical protein
MCESDKELAPQERQLPGARPIRRLLMDNAESSVHCAHPCAEGHDDTVEAHYSCLERLRPHACIEGWVFVGYIDEHGEEREASYACRRCTDSSRGQ